MTNYKEWNREQLLAMVELQEEEMNRLHWNCLSTNLMFVFAGALCGWVFSCYMMQ